MAEQVLVGATISADTKGAVDSIGSLKKQLREAQNDVQALSDKFGATSQQAINAAKKAAELKDRIGDAKALTDAYNPDAKFKGFAQTLQGVVGGFSAVQGALGLVGVESDQVEKTLLKVQSAMALSQGLNTILESVDAFKNFSKQIGLTSAAQKIYTFVMYGTAAATKATDAATKAASTSMRILRGLIATLGIGALIAGVTILISKISSWVGSTDSAKEANDKLNAAIEEQNKLFEKNRKALQNARQDAITEAKIKGASAEELFKINQAYGQKDIELTKSNAAEKLKTLQDFESKNLEVFYVNGQKRVRGEEAQVEQYKKLSKELEDANNTKNDAIRQSDVDAQNEQLRIADEGRATAKKNSSEATQLAEKRLQEEKDRLKNLAEANKQADADIRKAKQENYLASIKDEDERAKKKAEIDLKNRILEIDALTIDESKKRELKLQAAIDTQNQIDAIDTEAKNKQAQKDKEFAVTQAKKLEDTLSAAKERQDSIREATSTAEENELYDLTSKYAKRLELVKGNAEAEAALVKEYENIKKNLRINAINTELGNYASAAGSISQLLGQTTAAGKAFAIAEATINTYKAASQVFAAPVPGVAPVSLAVKIATMVSAIATGIKNVKSIIGVKGKGLPSGSAPQIPTISSIAPMAPELPQATLTQLDQRSINQLGSATNRAYVVESDVTNSQERIKRINRAARLN
jgi:hypothetical protein